MTTSRGKNPRGSSTICLPIGKEVYDSIVEDPEKFRAAVDQALSDMPELFPKAFAQGYIFKDSRLSRKLGMHLRRVECKATQEAFTVRPSFVMPYMTALTDEVRKALYLRSFGVPFHALVEVFGQGRYAVLGEQLLDERLVLGRDNRVQVVDARLRAARLYDKYLHERTRAMELYKEITTHETDPKRIAEAQKRLTDLSARK